ncbi:MAG: TOBE domain-containing protein, partial [Pseudomonadota bacterium]
FLGLDPLLRPDSVQADHAVIAGESMPVAGTRAAGPMLVALRPDKLSIEPDGQLALTVDAVRYRGLSCDVALKFADGQGLSIQVPGDARALYAKGAAVHVAMAPGAALLVPAGPAA